MVSRISIQVIDIEGISIKNYCIYSLQTSPSLGVLGNILTLPATPKRLSCSLTPPPSVEGESIKQKGVAFLEAWLCGQQTLKRVFQRQLHV